MTPRLHPTVVATATDNGMVLLDQTTGRYYELNTTGATIIHSLTEGTDPVQDLVAQTSVSQEQAIRDAAAFLGELRSRGLTVAS